MSLLDSFLIPVNALLEIVIGEEKKDVDDEGGDVGRDEGGDVGGDLDEDIVHKRVNLSKKREVFIKKHNNLIKLNYAPNNSFSNPAHLACRGSMFTTKKNFACAPLKFFTVGLGGGDQFSACMGMNFTEYLKLLEKEEGVIYFTNKYDGSLILIFADLEGKISASTRGCIDSANQPLGINKNITYAGAALEWLKDEKQEKTKKYLLDNPFHMMALELMSPWNTVVTKYDFTSGQKFSKINITPLSLTQPDGRSYWIKDICYPNDLYPTSNKSWISDRDNIFKDQENNPDVFGKNPEGLVAYVCYQRVDDKLSSKIYSQAIGKFKREEYLRAHALFTFDTGSPQDLCSLQLKLLVDGIDSVISAIDDQDNYETRRKHLVVFDSWLDDFSQVILEFIDNNLISSSKERKKNAIQINSSILIEWKSLMFNLLKHLEVEDKTKITGEIIRGYLVKHLLDGHLEKNQKANLENWFQKLVLVNK